MSFALHDPEPLPDVIKLTARERARKAELESIVSTNLEAFLKCGAALAEIRGKRLWRTEAPSFEIYCRQKFNLARSSADQLIRSSQVATSLIESGCALPANVTEATIRPLASLPDADLQSSCWKLAESFAPERGPSVRLVSKLCTVVKECLEDPLDEKNDEGGEGKKLGRPVGYSGSRSPGHEREVPFVGSVRRLATYPGFSVEIVISNVNKTPNAASLYQILGAMIQRCEMVRDRLVSSFPGITEA